MLTLLILYLLACIATPLTAQVWGARAVVISGSLLATPLVGGLVLVWRHFAQRGDRIQRPGVPPGICDDPTQYGVAFLAFYAIVALAGLALSTLVALMVVFVQRRRFSAVDRAARV